MFSIKDLILFLFLITNITLLASSKEDVTKINSYLNSAASNQSTLPTLTLQEGLEFSVILKTHPHKDICATTDGIKVAVWDLNSNRLLKMLAFELDTGEYIVDLNFSFGEEIAVEIGQSEDLFDDFIFNDESSQLVRTSIYGEKDTVSLENHTFTFSISEAIVSTRLMLANYASGKRLDLPNCTHFWFSPYAHGVYYFLDNKGGLWNNKGETISTKKGKHYLTTMAFWEHSEAVILGYSNGDVTIIRDFPKGINASTIATGLKRVTSIFCSSKYFIFTCAGMQDEGFVPIHFYNLNIFNPLEVPLKFVQGPSIVDNLAWNYLDVKFPQVDYSQMGTWFNYNWDAVNNRLFILHSKNCITVHNYNTGDVHELSGKDSVAVTNIGLYDDGKRVVMCSQIREGYVRKKLLATMDVDEDTHDNFFGKNFKELTDVNPSTALDVWFSEDSKAMYVGDSYSIEKYTLKNMSSVEIYSGLEAKDLRRLTHCSNNDFFVNTSGWQVAYYEGNFSERNELDFSFFVDLDPIERIQAIDKSNELVYSSIHEYEFENDTIKKWENSLRIRDFSGEKVKEIPSALEFFESFADPKFEISPKGNWLSIWNTRQGAIEIYATSNWKKVASLPVSEKSKVNDEVVCSFKMAFSEDESKLAIYVDHSFDSDFSIDKRNPKYEANHKKIHIYDLDITRKKATKSVTLACKKNLEELAFNPLTNQLTIAYTTNERYFLAVLNQSNEFELLLDGEGKFIYSLKYSPNGKLMALSAFDNIMLYDVENQRKIADIFSFGFGEDKNRLIIAPGGYYFGSKEALESFAFAYKGKGYPLEQFDLIYNRPDKVIAGISGHDKELVTDLEAAIIARGGHGQGVRSFNDLIVNIPILTLLDNVPNSVDSGSVPVNLRLDAGPKKLSLIHVYVNNISVFGRKGIKVLPIILMDTLLQIPLASGENVVEISVVNDIGVESLRESFTVLNSVKKPKPNLYYIGIGAAKYADPGNDLLFVDNDVIDFIELIKDSADIYNSIYDTLLLNEQVTKEAVEGLSTWLSNASPDDKVIVYYSGHGFIKDNNSFYLGAYDIDPKNPQLEGIPIETMNDLIDGIPVQRKLLLLNACQSGEDDSGINYHLIKKYFVNLTRDNGAFVISGTGTTGQFAQTAISIDDWDYEENSLFGYMTLQCIREYNTGGVYRLSSYLNRKIAQETFQEQQPRLKHANKKIGFKIW